MSFTPSKFGNYIDGAWQPAADGRTFANHNPADTRQLIGHFVRSGRPDCEQAITAATKAFSEWSSRSVTDRGQVLLKAADYLDARLAQFSEELTREEGKSLQSSREEWLRTCATLRYYATEALSHGGHTFPAANTQLSISTQLEPLGVVTVITPWNFPASIPARKIAPALATGNTVVFKPSSIAPLSGLRIVEALIEGGLPAGVLNYLTGEVEDFGTSLVTDQRIAAISFTGSTRAGKDIHRNASMTTRLQLELGGKNALVVMDDADLETAADLAIKGGLSLSGQACTGTSRVLVSRKRKAALVEKLRTRIAALSIGDGFSPDAIIGPLASAAQLEKVLGYVALGKTEATWVIGGAPLNSGDYAHGYYMTPALFDDVDVNARIAQEEIFGPVICVIAFDDYDDALRIVNATPYGLCASVVTQCVELAHAFTRDARVGVVKINQPTIGNVIHAPFGGVKWSSSNTYREAGRVALDFFTQIKTVYASV